MLLAPGIQVEYQELIRREEQFSGALSKSISWAPMAQALLGKM